MPVQLGQKISLDVDDQTTAMIEDDPFRSPTVRFWNRYLQVVAFLEFQTVVAPSSTILRTLLPPSRKRTTGFLFSITESIV
jgi:hypothetical protein